MNMSTIRFMTVVLGAMVGSFFTTFGNVCAKAYPKAFAEDAIRAKFAIGFMLGIGWSIRLMFWGKSACWLCIIASPFVGLVLGGVLLTAAHFVGEILWTTLTDTWSLGRSFCQSFIVKVSNG